MSSGLKAFFGRSASHKSHLFLSDGSRNKRYAVLHPFLPNTLHAIVAVLLVSLTLLRGGNLLAQQSLSHGTRGDSQAARPRRTSARPNVTGSDGSQTGVANFLGNLTTINAPDGEALVLSRRGDCSLLLATGSYSISSGLTYMPTGLTSNYERVLHSEAGLTTTPDVFASGCTPATTGIGSRAGLFVGTTTSGIDVFAAVGYYPFAMNNALFTITGTETTTYSFHASAIPSAAVVTAADLNKDGNGDLVLSNNVLTTNGSIYVLLGNADGSFQTAVQYPTAGSGTAAAVIDDVNGDGKLDIVTVSTPDITNGQQISVLLGNGDGSFQSAQSFSAPTVAGYTNESSAPIVNIITADTRGTGKKDIIGSNGLVLLGNGDGTFAAASAPAFPYFQASSSQGPNLASGDLNKDGKIDLVLDTGNDISVYLGNGDGTFTAGNVYASVATVGYVTISDLDGDGNNDIYVGLANGGYYEGDNFASNLSYALMGNGDGTFAGAPVVSNDGIFAAYTGTNLGDVNGDGLPDLIVQGTNSNNTFTSVFTVDLGTSKGSFNPASTITMPASFVLGGSTISSANVSVYSYAVGDVNGDGKADLVFLTNGASSLTYSGLIYWTALSNGDGTFATPVPSLLPQIAPTGDVDSTSPTITGLHLADLNGDGKADMLFTFSEVGGSPTGPFTYTNLSLEGFTVLPGNGDGTFGTPVSTYTYNSATPAPNLTSPPEVVNIADLNDDGKQDVLAVSSNGAFNTDGDLESKLQAFLGNGDGTFGAPATVTTTASITVPQSPYSNSPCALADFNKDGKLDLACPGADANANPQLAIALGNGDGTFATPTILGLTGGTGYTQGGIEAGIASADFNGDGNLDLALIVDNSYSGILYGNGDGTFTSVNTANGIVPKDLINIGTGFPVIAADFNGDGKPDILAGNTILLNLHGSATTPSLAATTTALTASTSTITVGESVTFTTTVTGASGSTETPTGTVTFLDGATTLGTGSLASGIATYTTMALPAGANSITAVYGGDANFSGSTSSASVVTVNAAAPAAIGTTTTLSASATNAVSGTSLTFTAAVAAALGSAIPTGTVTFTDGSTTLGSGSLDSTGTATYSTSSLTVGAHNITAAYGGSTAFSSSTSIAVSVTITPPAASASFTLSLSSTAGTMQDGGTTTSTLTIAPTGGFNQPISLSCTGAPKNATCAISPTSVTPNGTSATTATLTIRTGVKTAALDRPPFPNGTTRGTTALAFLGAGAVFGFTWWGRKRRNWRYMALGVALTLLTGAVVIGCGGSGNSTPSGTYTIKVTGTSGNNTQTATYSLTVQ
jgi:hypothetical protein